MSFFKSLSVYTLTSMVNAGIPFLLLPVLTYYLTSDEYGLLAMFQIFIVFTIPFISINIQSTLQLEYHELTKDEFTLWVSSVLFIPVITVVVVSLLFVLLEFFLKKFLDISLLWLLFIPLVAFMQVVPQTILSIYKISERPISFAKYQLSLTFVNFSLTLGLVMLLHLNWEGRLLAILGAYFVFSLLGLWLLFKMKLIVLKIRKEYVTKALSLGFPLILHVVSAALFMMSDRLFISYYLGNDAVGIYSVGAQVAMIAMIVQTSFNQAWVPYLFKNLKIGFLVNKIKIVKISYATILFFILLPFIIDLITPLIFTLLVDNKFVASMEYVFWIAVGYSLLGMYKVVTNYIFYEKRVHILSMMTFASLIINLLLNYFLIHKYGAIGVAYGTVVTVGIFFLIAFVVANRVHPMPWLFFIKEKK